MIRALAITCVIIGYGVPTGYYYQSGFIAPALILVLIGCTLLINYWKNIGWVYGIALFVGVTANGIGVVLQFPGTELLLSTVFMLWSWDLSRFIVFMDRASPEDPNRTIEIQHIKTTSLFFLVVFLVSQFAVIVELRPTFLQSVILVITAFIGILQLVRWLVSTSKKHNN